ncbi:MAG TPA: hypothetical protein VGR71_03990, partial [Nitrospira sp.]|nr:hypothetical protein [Nitrospira sp.]
MGATRSAGPAFAAALVIVALLMPLAGVQALLVTVQKVPAPVAAVYDPSKGEVFVANYQDNTVSVIADANNSVVATVRVGIDPFALVYDASKGEVFVANNGNSSLSVISDSSDSVVATVPVGSGPIGLAYDSS